MAMPLSASPLASSPAGVVRVALPPVAAAPSQLALSFSAVSTSPAQPESAPVPATSPAGAGPAIELKGTTVAVIAVLVGEADPARLEAALEAKLGRATGFFEGEAALLDFSRMDESDRSSVDPAAVVALVKRFGLMPVGVRGLPESMTPQLSALGLALLPPAPAARQMPAAGPGAAAANAPSEASVAPAAVAPTAGESMSDATEAALVQASLPIEPTPTTALVVDRPVRSGQRIYAKGRDLVLLAAVNPGGEVIADGSVHCYATLRGRAAAGASGDTKARIFAASFQAELVSIAGVYKNFETIPAALRGRQLSVRLHGDEGGRRIALEPVNTN